MQNTKFLCTFIRIFFLWYFTSQMTFCPIWAKWTYKKSLKYCSFYMNIKSKPLLCLFLSVDLQKTIIVIEIHEKLHDINLRPNPSTLLEKLAHISVVDPGGSTGMRPPRGQILSFWHTNFSKRSCLGSWRSPYEVGAPLREILDPLLYINTNGLDEHVGKQINGFFSVYVLTKQFYRTASIYPYLTSKTSYIDTDPTYHSCHPGIWNERCSVVHYSTQSFRGMWRLSFTLFYFNCLNLNSHWRVHFEVRKLQFLVHCCYCTSVRHACLIFSIADSCAL